MKKKLNFFDSSSPIIFPVLDEPKLKYKYPIVNMNIESIKL
jgi:hypothetical protein